MAQSWHDLLFAHWPITYETLRPTLPSGLELDTYDGAAWVGVVPFRMSGVRPRGLVAAPWLSAFPELNVRTYVTLGNKPGVFFYALDAANPVAVQIARRWFRLPYFNARMSMRRDGDQIVYASERTHTGAAPAVFRATYQPTGAEFRTKPGSLEHWLTERYALYTVDERGRLYRGDIHHAPWPLQPAAAHFEINTMAAAHGITLPDQAPLLHFAQRLDVAVWPLQRVAQ